MKSKLTVTTPATSTELTTLESLKAALGIESTSTAQETLLRQQIRRASGVAADYCRRVFGQEIVTETFWPSGGAEVHDVILLDRYPVTDIATVTLDDEDIDTDLVRLDGDAGLLYRIDSSGYAYSWTICKALAISYTAGFALLDGLPDGIEQGVLTLIKDYWSAVGRDPRIKSEEIPGVITFDYWVGNLGTPGELPPDVVAHWAPHRRPMA